MTQVAVSASPGGTEKCIFCHQAHKPKKQRKLSDSKYSRNDETLIKNGRTFIKSDESRYKYYPTDDAGNFVPPLEDAAWRGNTNFKKYQTSSGQTKAHAEKYQPPPIIGYIAAPHHMVAVCCMNGENKLPSVPKLRPWAKRGKYDINGGSNCIFLPSSASQFFVAYYYMKKRRTGKALQGHLGAHRKKYFIKVWEDLEQIVKNKKKAGLCNTTDKKQDKDKIAEEVKKSLHRKENHYFQKLAARQPDEDFKLGAESYIAVPSSRESVVSVRARVRAFLQQPYETLPRWY
jgi:hypothetical protein